MAKKIGVLVFRIVRGLVRLFYPKTEIVGAENLPGEASIVVGNHTQMNGPIVGEIYFPGKRRIWCAAQMMRFKEVAAYAFEDFWSFKPRRVRWLYRIAAHLLPPLSVSVFNNARTIPVYRDARLVTTFRETMRCLDEGENIIIFPERNQKYNHILYDFQDRFIDVAWFYYRQTGKALNFVPMYIAPRLHAAYIGKPTRFRPDSPRDQERARIRDYLMSEITAIACGIPRHVVVPYRNIPRREYPINLPPKEERDI